MAFMTMETETHQPGMKVDEIKPGNLIEKGEQIQRSCLRTVVSFLAPYRGPKVRRPMSGIELKQESHAHIWVTRDDGTDVMLYSSVGDTATKRGHEMMGKYYTDFLLQAVSESRAEKAQVVETFGETFLFLYGERPRTISARGVLLNSHDFPWRTEFWENYDKFLRGTKCAEKKARAYLSWDDIMVEGYILKAEAHETASQPNQIEFAITMLLTDYLSIGTQLFNVWAEAAAEALQGPRTLFDFTKDLYNEMAPGSPEYIGSLQDDIKSITTGRAILVSQDMREWLMDQPWEIFSQLDPRIASILQFGTDPKGALKEHFGSPLKAFSTVMSVTPAGMMPNEVCLAAVAAEDIMRIAQDPFGALMAGLGAATPWIEDMLDYVSTPGGIESLLGDDGLGWDLDAAPSAGL